MKVIQNALIALIAGATLAQPAHISLDSEFGPDTITFDTATGLEWLDLTVTYMRSTDWVEAEMAPGGWLHGWRYATRTEFIDFIDPYLVPTPPGAGCCYELAGALAFIDLVGPGPQGPGRSMWGLMDPIVPRSASRVRGATS